MKSNNWRTEMTYIDSISGRPIRKGANRVPGETNWDYLLPKKSPVREKYLATEKETGKVTTASLMRSGKVLVGDDVWRLSNKADCCEYPFKIYASMDIAKQDYIFSAAPKSMLSEVIFCELPQYHHG